MAKPEDGPRVNEQGEMDANEIQRLIPHRPPFLWLDEIVEIDDSRVEVCSNFVRNIVFDLRSSKKSRND